MFFIEDVYQELFVSFVRVFRIYFVLILYYLLIFPVFLFCCFLCLVLFFFRICLRESLSCLLQYVNWINDHVSCFLSICSQISFPIFGLRVGVGGTGRNGNTKDSKNFMHKDDDDDDDDVDDDDDNDGIFFL